MHLQFLLAIVLVLLSFPLDCAYCRSFATPWPVAILSVSNLNSVWAQASIPHTSFAPLFPPRFTGLCWRHVGTFATYCSPSLWSDVFNSGNEAGRLVTSILGQPALSSDSSHFSLCHQNEFSDSSSGAAPHVHRSAGCSPVGKCCHCHVTVTIYSL